MVTELRHYFDHLYENDQTRVVLLGGRGSAFAPVWTSSRPAILGASALRRRHGASKVLPRCTSKSRRCPQPIISLIQGPACGGGFAFALASDVRIAADTAK
ncbi:MAG: hypothetical protein CM15mP120_04580 [Pseudomonadota bacterium]|nr:MAG: hypothetical protein CM15mP120_04580 [Pseudomonadota bacterium]